MAEGLFLVLDHVHVGFELSGRLDHGEHLHHGLDCAAFNEALVNRLLWMQDSLQLTARDRVLQKTAIGFDVAVWEWFLPLMTGAALVVARPDGQKDTDYLQSMIHAPYPPLEDT